MIVAAYSKRALWTKVQSHLPPLFKMRKISRRDLKRVALGHRANGAIGIGAPLRIDWRIYQQGRGRKGAIGIVDHANLGGIFLALGKG